MYYYGSEQVFSFSLSFLSLSLFLPSFSLNFFFFFLTSLVGVLSVNRPNGDDPACGMFCHASRENEKTFLF